MFNSIKCHLYKKRLPLSPKVERYFLYYNKRFSDAPRFSATPSYVKNIKPPHAQQAQSILFLITGEFTSLMIELHL